MVEPASVIAAPAGTNSCPTCGSQGEGSVRPVRNPGKPCQPRILHMSMPWQGRTPLPAYFHREGGRSGSQTNLNGRPDGRAGAEEGALGSARWFLARLVCWVLRIEDQETFILHPRDPLNFSVLVEALRDVPRPTDLDAVVGIRA